MSAADFGGGSGIGVFIQQTRAKSGEQKDHRISNFFPGGLPALLPRSEPTLRCVGIALDIEDKRAAFGQLRREGREGAVFKETGAPFSPGRPNSGGTQRKFKFVETASFVVTGINRARSVSLGLHAFRESGSVYQPVYLGERDDIPAGECGIDQLKYKAEPMKATA